MEMPATPKLIPTASAAAALGITAAAIRKLAQRQQLTRHGTRQRARYDMTELEDLEKRRSAAST